ncbi:protein of unknown function (plasmid) [Rhodovastum atsumiense]|nr:protein of unknown function [Rhodovastum atsumiense]
MLRGRTARLMSKIAESGSWSVALPSRDGWRWCSSAPRWLQTGITLRHGRGRGTYLALDIAFIVERLCVHFPQRCGRASTNAGGPFRTEGAEIAFHGDGAHADIPCQQRIKPGRVLRLVDPEPGDAGDRCPGRRDRPERAGERAHLAADAALLVQYDPAIRDPDGIGRADTPAWGVFAVAADSRCRDFQGSRDGQPGKGLQSLGPVHHGARRHAGIASDTPSGVRDNKAVHVPLSTFPVHSENEPVHRLGPLAGRCIIASAVDKNDLLSNKNVLTIQVYLCIPERSVGL